MCVFFSATVKRGAKYLPIPASRGVFKCAFNDTIAMSAKYNEARRGESVANICLYLSIKRGGLSDHFVPRNERRFASPRVKNALFRSTGVSTVRSAEHMESASKRGRREGGREGWGI